MSSTSQEAKNQHPSPQNQLPDVFQSSTSRRRLFANPFERVKGYINGLFEPINNDKFLQPPSEEDRQLTRRNLIGTASNETKGIAGYVVGGTWELMNDIVNALGDKVFGRKKFVIGMGLFGLTVGALGKVLQDNPNLYQDAKIGLKFAHVWAEVQELQKEYTNQQLIDMLHNPFGKDGKIQLTAEEAADLLFVGDADSMYLEGGDRKNSLGVLQPKCWLMYLKDKINDGLQKLNIKGNVQYANYAQPGAASPNIIGPQQVGIDKEGAPIVINVQLGATSQDEMRGDNYDNPPIPPRDAIRDHKGTVVAAYGLHGNDLHPTAEFLMSLLDPESNSYNAELDAFVQDPTKDRLENSDALCDLLVKILESYKADKARIQEYLPKALDIYKRLNAERQGLGNGKMYLVVTQPFRFDQAKKAPYAPPNAQRGARGSIDLEKYGSGGKVAGLLATLPFYTIEAPLLKAFEEETGIRVISLPMINLSGEEDLVDDTGHLIWKGHQKFGEDEVPQVFEISDEKSNKILTFNKAEPVISQIAA